MNSKRQWRFIVIAIFLIFTFFTSVSAIRYRSILHQTLYEYNILKSMHRHLKSELHTLFQKRKEIKAWQTDWYKPLYESQGINFQEEQKKRIVELEAGIDLILDNYKDS